MVQYFPFSSQLLHYSCGERQVNVVQLAGEAVDIALERVPDRLQPQGESPQLTHAAADG